MEFCPADYSKFGPLMKISTSYTTNFFLGFKNLNNFLKKNINIHSRFGINYSKIQ